MPIHSRIFGSRSLAPAQFCTQNVNEADDQTLQCMSTCGDPQIINAECGDPQILNAEYGDPQILNGDPQILNTKYGNPQASDPQILNVRSVNARSPNS